MSVSDETEVKELKTKFSAEQLEGIVACIEVVKQQFYTNYSEGNIEDRVQKIINLDGMGSFSVLDVMALRSLKEGLRRVKMTGDDTEITKALDHIDFYYDRESDRGVGIVFSINFKPNLNPQGEVITELGRCFDVCIAEDDDIYEGYEEKNIKKALEDVYSNTLLIDNNLRISKDVAYRLMGFRTELQEISEKYGVYLEECGNVCYTKDDSFGGVHMTYHIGRNEEEITLTTDAVDDVNGEMVL